MTTATSPNTREQVTSWFAAAGITVTACHIVGDRRHMLADGHPFDLPLGDSPDDCLRTVREALDNSDRRCK